MNKYKKYLVFAFEQYYPRGGFSDFKNSYDTIEEAQAEGRKQIKKYYQDYVQIIDRDTLEQIEFSENK